MQTKYKLNHSLFIFGLMILFFSAAFPLVQAQSVAPGDLDTTFGSGGKVTTFFSQFSGGEDVAVQADGKIVVAGVASLLAPGPQIAVARYNADGSLDASFGTGGGVTTSVAHQTNASSLAIQTDGRIVVAGAACGASGGCDFTVVRYTVTGALDTSFDGDGKAVIDFGNNTDWAHDVAVQPDSKIVLAGLTVSSAGTRLALARLNSSGSLDSSFDNDGRLVLGVNSAASAVVIQTDGKIIAAGRIGNSALVRFHADGSLDSSFDSDGIVITSEADNYKEVTLQSDGKIVAVSQANSSFAVARYNSNGSLDTSFGGNGIVITSFGEKASAYSLAIQSNGKIIAGGSSGDNFALVRYNPNGSLDTSFGTGGKVTTDFGRRDDYYGAAFGLAIQPDGKIVAAGGWGFDFDEYYFAIARYIGDSPVTNRKLFDFDGDGKADVSVFRPSNGVWYLQQSQAGFTGIQFGQAGDKIVPADYDGDGKTDVAVYRDGIWYLQRSLQGFTGVPFGAATDIPVPADYDGDGNSEIAVFRPSNGVWYIYNLVSNQFSAVQFGQTGDVPVVADYDADAKADVAVFRNGTWYIQKSRDGFTGMSFGESTDKPVSADYDGDAKTDIAVFRPSNGTWYLLQSTAGFTGVQFGLGTDEPVPADYDGDNKADIAVFREGTWYLQRSTQGFTGIAFGNVNDKPIPAAYLP
ncbi:MAG: FG-GAP-like repeat-containing protein [Acidobacteria bacterium]|nr:FG-GAP-like repeat-containing protein [Acidobacteriota bacterium]MCA1638700.1 FG-GAP-like repeat-containing protein [Acidobacteriota bacterium]